MTLLLNVLELFVFIINDVIKVFNFILVSITSTFPKVRFYYGQAYMFHATNHIYVKNHEITGITSHLT